VDKLYKTRRFQRLGRVFLCFTVILLSSTAAPLGMRPASASQQITEITQTLLQLMEKQDSTKITSDDYASTSLKDLVTLGTPAGYRLKLRYLNFGISLVEGLKVARDPELKRRLIEMAQWSRNSQVRAQAIVTLASLFDPTHKKYFKEAILDRDIAIRFAAVEALQLWNQPEALPLLRMAMDRDWSPLMKIEAAQALLSLGQTDAIQVLWTSLDDNSWVVRAMAAHYLGDFGAPDDYEKLLTRLEVETSRNDFVVAELSIACLKLISRKNEKISYNPASKGWRDNEEVKYTMGKDSVIELEPLIIIPPQLRVPPSLQAAARINGELLRLIRDRLGVPLDPLQAQDPVVINDLNNLNTPTGFATKTRYTELSYLVVEALAGTSDPTLRGELQRFARESTNPLVKADALIALAYSRNEDDLNLMQDALGDKNSLVRFGAMEAIEEGRFKSAVPSLVGIAQGDPSSALQVYAMQLLAKFGDPSGRNLMLTKLDDPDWPSRAMSFWYLGRYGQPDDYPMILARLPVEQNPFVQAEITLAALRLAPVESQ